EDRWKLADTLLMHESCNRASIWSRVCGLNHFDEGKLASRARRQQAAGVATASALQSLQIRQLGIFKGVKRRECRCRERMSKVRIGISGWRYAPWPGWGA